jgi:hypothetical protein
MVTTAVSNLRGMGVFLLLIAPHNYARGVGGSTAGPSHSETSDLGWGSISLGNFSGLWLLICGRAVLGTVIFLAESRSPGWDH